MKVSANIQVDAKYVPTIKSLIKDLNGVYTPLCAIKEKVLDKIDDAFLAKEVEEALQSKENPIKVDINAL